ncbi:ubiquinone biosynthesis regulatory protein kinase UbiB [Francisellaceae bacterium]|nr:ubiquinone biosynthesis regulatory protein kinase UbiB [Francisellaceae bacterium]
MRFTEKWFRLIYIAYIFNKYNLAELLGSIPLLKAISVFIYANPFYWIRSRKLKGLSREERLRIALETLGPIFIKFGQALSTRPDLIPPVYAQELSKLQDNVPPFSNSQSKAIIEKSLGYKVEHAFSSFGETPLASASIAQVHEATLIDGTEVVIKVLRPGIKSILKKDTALLKVFAEMIHRYIPSSRRLKPIEVVAEITRDLFDELDLLREGANAAQLRRNWKDSDIHYVPEVYWKYCRENILVLEKITGTPATNVQKLRDMGVDLKLLAERGVEIFYTQVFRDCFFHADMHPGNIFVDINNPADPRYISVDFGIIGTLTREDQQYLAGNFLAFFTRDYKKVAELHIDSGWVPPDTRVEELESAIRTVCEPIFGLPLSEISFGYTLMRLFQVARRFNMEVQPQLVLLQKTLLNIEGMGRELYPDLNLWATAKPFLEKWMKKHIGIKGFVERFIDQAPQLSEKLPEVPELIFEIMEYQRGHLRQQKIKELKSDEFLERQKSRSRRRGFALAAGTGLISFAVLFTAQLSILSPIKSFFMAYAGELGILGAIIILWYLFTQPGK